MKLNKRIAFSIIPVLSICYAAFFVSTYHFYTEALLQSYVSKAQMDASKLVLIASRYVGFGESLHSTLVQSAMIKQAWATGDKEYLASAVNSSFEAVSEQFNFKAPSNISFMVLTSSGRQAFSLKGDDSVESEFLKLIRESNGGGDSKFQKWKKINGLHHLLYAQPLSQHEATKLAVIPVPYDITLAYYFDMPDMDLATQQMRAVGYEIKINNGGLPSEIDSIFKFRTQVADDISFDVLMDQEGYKREANIYFARMLIGFIGVVLFSGLVLMVLVRRYVTVPIMRLQKDISNADETALPDYTQGNDEINQLGREFSILYHRLQQAHDATKVLAETDTLTQLPNRYTFNLELNKSMSEAIENNRQMAMLYIDLDYFKTVNDRFGHQAGDAILCDFSDELRNIMRIFDSGNQSTIARLAGDEFAILLSSFNNEIEIHNICIRIIDLFKKGFLSSMGRFPISASIGVSLFPYDGASAREIMRNADAAMYQAKHSGRNQYKFYSSDMADKSRREMDVLEALERHPVDEFSLKYMSIVNAETNAVETVEALFRWESATLGSLMPGEFIPIAESKGIFEKLDYWVVNRVLDDLPKLKKIYGDKIVVAINISSAQLNSTDFFINIIDLFSYRNVDLANIQIEITETFAADIGLRVEANFEILRKAGISVALDDFGTGYTALSQLIDYPLDVVKIDKSLIDRMDNEQGLMLVWALIDFCKQQNFKVVAEGVETADQAMTLRAAGVDALQGFYFSKPKPISELLSY